MTVPKTKTTCDYHCKEYHGKEGQDLQPEGKGRSEE